MVSTFWIVVLCVIGYIIIGQVVIVMWRLFSWEEDDSPYEWGDITFGTLLWPFFVVLGIVLLIYRGCRTTHRHMDNPFKKIASFYLTLVNKVPNIPTRKSS